MRNMPRILPLVGVAIVGVLAINAVSGANGASDLLSGARAFAEEAVKPDKKAKGKEAETQDAAVGEAKDATAVLPPPAIKPTAVCAPTAAELAKQAGLSPAELQVLQSLGERRGQLDQREDQLSTQLALMAAAEAKLDAKVKALNALKSDIQGLVAQADQREESELARLVKVFESMKPKNAAERIVLLDDETRLPIAAKMKERALSAVIAQMPPPEAKRLTESLAKRYKAAQILAAGASNAANAAAAATPTAKPAPAAAAAAPAPKKQAQARPKAKPKPAPAKTAEATPAPVAPTVPAPVAAPQPAKPS